MDSHDVSIVVRKISLFVFLSRFLALSLSLSPSSFLLLLLLMYRAIIILLLTILQLVHIVIVFIVSCESDYGLHCCSCSMSGPAKPVRLAGQAKTGPPFSANLVMIVAFTNAVCMNVVMIVTISMVMSNQCSHVATRTSYSTSSI